VEKGQLFETKYWELSQDIIVGNDATLRPISNTHRLAMRGTREFRVPGYAYLGTTSGLPEITYLAIFTKGTRTN